MNIGEVMSTNVAVVDPSMGLQEAARMMRELDVGSLPVGDGDRLVGMLTDRDIVIRAVADGGTGSMQVGDVMSGAIKYCYDSDDVEKVAANMASLAIRRLPVVDRHKRLVGIVSLSNMAHSEDEACERVAKGVATPH